jgi:xanthine dehydrogenase small subunit
MPLANAQSKHIVTIEGINPPNRELTPVQQCMVEENGTQCGFCTVGFVMSLTGFCAGSSPKTEEEAISAIDGNICRCTGYKSIERAAATLTQMVSGTDGQTPLEFSIQKGIVPAYFREIKTRLKNIHEAQLHVSGFGSASGMLNPKYIVGGGTDLYVQRHDEMEGASAIHVYDRSNMRGIREFGDYIEIGASATVSDMLASPVLQQHFPNLRKHLKLVSSTPIRNMATIAGNLVNASPIGDITVWLLALDAKITIGNQAREREIALKHFYLGYKTLSKAEYEMVTKVRFRKPGDGFHFNFEKVSKRTYLDIASVNTAISVRIAYGRMSEVHVSAGGVAPIPLYLKKTSEFLTDKPVSEGLVLEAAELLQTEISPISDVRGSAEYKRLLLRQLFSAHFVEMFAEEEKPEPDYDEES